jgi:hypothetical protein
MLLNKAERHATVDDALLDRVADENHVLLERRSRLLILQGLQLKKSGFCAFALGEKTAKNSHAISQSVLVP